MRGIDQSECLGVSHCLPVLVAYVGYAHVVFALDTAFVSHQLTLFGLICVYYDLFIYTHLLHFQFSFVVLSLLLPLFFPVQKIMLHHQQVLLWFLDMVMGGVISLD